MHPPMPLRSPSQGACKPVFRGNLPGNLVMATSWAVREALLALAISRPENTRHLGGWHTSASADVSKTARIPMHNQGNAKHGASTRPALCQQRAMLCNRLNFKLTFPPSSNAA